MIPKADIVAWRQFAPWVTDAQVEQDLIISRALVSIFQNSYLAERLAFRGGTALHKLYFTIPRRFAVQSRWFKGDCEITTYTLEELLATTSHEYLEIIKVSFHS